MTIAIVLNDYQQSLSFIPSIDVSKYLFELRVDLDPELLNLINHPSMHPYQLILTYRSQQEGGGGIGEFPKDILQQITDVGLGYLDLEVYRDQQLIEDIANRLIQLKVENLILSCHDYSKPYMEALNDYQQYVSTLSIPQMNIINKFVGQPQDVLDSLQLLNSKVFPNQVLLGINHNGDITRTLADRFNQSFVFGAMRPDQQILPFDILDKIHQNGIYLGLIGSNVGNSLSPIIHHQFLDYTQTPGYYHLMDVSRSSQLEDLLNYLSQLNFSGLNVTIPYKTDIIQLLTSISENAANLNSVNTLIFKNNEILGENTDISGFDRVIMDNELHQYDKVLIMGAGGAARSCAAALINRNIDVTIMNRSVSRFNDIPSTLRGNLDLESWDVTLINHAEILINATPMSSLEFNQLSNQVKSIKMGIDLNYSKDITPFVKLCQHHRIPTFDGKQMLFHQAADAFEIWTGKVIDRSVVYNDFLGKL